jgi:hypothetical protein
VKVIVYLQHDRDKPIKIEVKDMDKLRGYLKAGRVKIKEKWYNIITEDIEVMLDWWDDEPKPTIHKSSRVYDPIPTDPYAEESCEESDKSSRTSKTNKEVWSEYKKLKHKVKHLKQTGEWLDD